MEIQRARKEKSTKLRTRNTGNFFFKMATLGKFEGVAKREIIRNENSRKRKECYSEIHRTKNETAPDVFCTFH
jgi:hypothetical protein